MHLYTAATVSLPPMLDVSEGDEMVEVCATLALPDDAATAAIVTINLATMETGLSTLPIVLCVLHHSLLLS